MLYINFVIMYVQAKRLCVKWGTRSIVFAYLMTEQAVDFLHKKQKRKFRLQIFLFFRKKKSVESRKQGPRLVENNLFMKQSGPQTSPSGLKKPLYKNQPSRGFTKSSCNISSNIMKTVFWFPVLLKCKNNDCHKSYVKIFFFFYLVCFSCFSIKRAGLTESKMQHCILR